MIKVIYIANTFEPKKGRTITEHKWSGKKLYEYIPPYLHEPTVALNQLHVKEFNVIVPDNSEIIIAPKQEVTAIAGWIATSVFGAGSLAAAGMAATVASYAIGTAVMMAGSMLLSSVLAPGSQSPNSATQSINESPTYSWNPTQTLPRAGSPVPVLYGSHQLAGNVIQRRIEYIDDDEYLYLQLALCMGEIENVFNGNILINDTPFKNFQDIEYSFTNGTIEQGVMRHFNDVETPNSFMVDLKNTSVVRQTVGDASEALRLFLRFPNGLFYQNDKGGLDSREVEFKIEYKKKTDTEWTTVKQHDKRYSHTLYLHGDCKTNAQSWLTSKGSTRCPFSWKKRGGGDNGEKDDGGYDGGGFDASEADAGSDSTGWA